MSMVNDSKKAREYTQRTRNMLFTLCGNQCAEPTCEKSVIGSDRKTTVGIISHIEAASADGPRFNPEMTDDERRDFSNLMLLCDEHHKIIDNKDNEPEYPVSLLQKWKSDHEAKMVFGAIQGHPAILTEVINSISKVDTEEGEKLVSVSGYKIAEKVSYNRLKRYKPFVDEYKVYYGKLDKIYREMDEYGDKRKKLFRIIKHIYLSVKGSYLESGSSTEFILENSDDVMDEVKEIIEAKIAQDFANGRVHDDAQVAVIILMVDAFIRCKILEEPPKNYVN